MLLCIGALLACGCGLDRRSPPNIVLVVVDTLRTDRLGCYGADRDTSPNIDRLASEGIRFERAYSTAPWTKPAVASILTGLYPSAHRADALLRPLPWNVSTLAEILKQDGYATAGVISHNLINSRHHYHQGFDEYLEPKVLSTKELSTQSVTRTAVRFVERFAGGDAPFFLFVHYFDPHYPYMPHPEVGFASAGAGRLKGGEPVAALRKMLPSLGPDEMAFIRALYDEEVRFTDEGIGRLLGALEEQGVAGDTLVVLTADHGEEFGERGWLGHTRTLYEELVRVPLILRLPDGEHAGRVLDAPVSVVDVVPTVLALAGLGAPGIAFPGRSLLAEPEPRPVLIEVDYEPPRPEKNPFRVHKKALISGRHKIIRDGQSGSVELYDLAEDPGEREDLAAAQPERVRELVAELERKLRLVGSVSGRSEPLELRPEQLEHLRALGYVGDEPAQRD